GAAHADAAPRPAAAHGPGNAGEERKRGASRHRHRRRDGEDQAGRRTGDPDQHPEERRVRGADFPDALGSDHARDVAEAVDGTGRDRPAVGRITTAAVNRRLPAYGIDHPHRRATEPDADSGARRRSHLHHGARGDRAPRLQRPREREDAAGRFCGHPYADGDGDLQRSHANQLDRTPHALAIKLQLPRPEVPMKLTVSGPLVVSLALVFGAASPRLAVAAQSSTSVTSSDIQRLEKSIDDAARDVSQASSRDSALGSQLQAELDEARDEVTYLKVKQ